MLNLKFKGLYPKQYLQLRTPPQEAAACQHGLKSLWTAKSNLRRWLCSSSPPASTAEGSTNSSAIALQTRVFGI